jgi:zinc/manganese transport system ATP-binding protein
MGGRIELCGYKPQDIAYLPQQAEIDHSFPLSVYEMAAMGLWRRIGAFTALRPEHHSRVEEALTSVGLAGLEDRTLDTLSGGQLQRVLFARLMVQDAAIILLDEPFAAIDARTCDDLMSLIRNWHAQGRTILAVLHDFALVHREFAETLLLAREPIAWGPTAEVLDQAHLSQARVMSEAWPEAADYCLRIPA